MTTDLRFVAEEAKLQFAFVRRGIMPELGSLRLLERIVGRQVASDLLMSGRMFSGAEAKEMGLAARVLPADEVLPAALEWAHDVAANTAPQHPNYTARGGNPPVVNVATRLVPAEKWPAGWSTRAGFATARGRSSSAAAPVPKWG